MSRYETGTGCVYRADCHGNAAGYDSRCAHRGPFCPFWQGLSVGVAVWIFLSVTRSRAMVCDESVEPGLEKPDPERGICSTDYVTIQVNTSCFLCFALIYPAVDCAWAAFQE